MNRKEFFYQTLYTPFAEAREELERRKQDSKLVEKLQEFLAGDIPPQFGKNGRAVLARHVITPNYEVSRFLSLADGAEMEPLFFEYHEDIMMYQNPWKYFLGRLGFYLGRGKKGGEKVDFVNIIDFDKAHGKPLSSIKTLWGESLIDFHHTLFLERFPRYKDVFFDASNWYANNGKDPILYYERFFSLFITEGILFENFLLDEDEIHFTETVVLPAFIRTTQRFGVRPLIVALNPTEVESDRFWLYHPPIDREMVDKKNDNRSIL